MKHFAYTLYDINQSQPVPIPNLPEVEFNWEWDLKSHKETGDTIVTIRSETFFDLDGPKMISGISGFNIPMEQPTLATQENFNLVLAELSYQHIARQVDLVYNISQTKIILTSPTIAEMLEIIENVE